MNEELRPLPIIELTSEKWMKRFRQDRLVYSINWISPTVITFGGGGFIPMIVVYEHKDIKTPTRIL